MFWLAWSAGPPATRIGAFPRPTSPPAVLPRLSDTYRKSGCPRRLTRSRRASSGLRARAGLTASAPSVAATASFSCSSEQPKISPLVSNSARSRRKPKRLCRETSSPDTSSSRRTYSSRRESRERLSSHASSARVERSSTVTPRCHADGYPVECHMLGPRIGQGAEQDLPVVPGDHAPVEQHDRAVVGLRADQPSEPLPEP